jgi:glycine cleavage system aminomethyltransferase T
VTSAMRSPQLGKTIALARLDVAHAALGALPPLRPGKAASTSLGRNGRTGAAVVRTA